MAVDQLLVARVDDQLVERLVQEHGEVGGVELVQRVVAGEIENESVRLPAPPRTPDALPRRHDTVREPGEDHPVEASDVDAELQRVRGEHQPDLALAQAVLDFVAILGVEATTEDADGVHVQIGPTVLP